MLPENLRRQQTLDISAWLGDFNFHSVGSFLAAACFEKTLQCIPILSTRKQQRKPCFKIQLQIFIVKILPGTIVGAHTSDFETRRLFYFWLCALGD